MVQCVCVCVCARARARVPAGSGGFCGETAGREAVCVCVCVCVCVYACARGQGAFLQVEGRRLPPSRAAGGWVKATLRSQRGIRPLPVRQPHGGDSS